MRIAIFSDLHANAEALACLTRRYDELWFLGDVVGYGPDVETAIDFVRRNCSLAIRGNHDNAAVTDDAIGCSPANEMLALATCDYTRARLDTSQRAFLRSLPHLAQVERASTRFLLVHGSPRDPLYEYVRTLESADLAPMLDGLDVDVLFLGHTHVPMLRRVGRTLVVNPGSLGQPRDGDWRASYCIWEDGAIRLHRSVYDRERMLDKVRQMPIPPAMHARLLELLGAAQDQVSDPTWRGGRR